MTQGLGVAKIRKGHTDMSQQGRMKVRTEPMERNHWASHTRVTVFMEWITKWGTAIIRGDTVITQPM